MKTCELVMPETSDFAMARPGDISYGSVGSGSSHHLYGFRLAEAAGINLLHVAYKGGAPATVGLVGGEVHAAFADYVSLKPFVAAAKVRLLAVTGPQRPALTPEVPTLKELGHSGFDAYGWGALFVPAKTPLEVAQRLQAAVAQVLKSPRISSRSSLTSASSSAGHHRRRLRPRCGLTTSAGRTSSRKLA